MTHEEKMHLLHALMAASNAFHKSLRESGYHVSYGMDKTGSIYKDGVPLPHRWPLGELTIKWELKKETDA